MKAHFGILLLFAVLTAIMTFPTVTDMDRKIDLGDPMLNAWILASNFRALTTGPLQIFDTNIYYPYSNTLTFSDPLIAPVLYLFPLFLSSENYIFIHNAGLLLGYALSAYFMYLFSYHLVKNRVSAFTAGFIYAFCHFSLSHIYWIQLGAQWIPLTFLFLIKTYENPRWKTALFCCLALLLQMLTGLYHMVYLSIGVTLFLLYRLKGIHQATSRRFVLQIVAALFLLGAISFPLWHTYWKTHTELNFQRSIDLNIDGSAVLTDYLVPYAGSTHDRMFSSKLSKPVMYWEKRLFPGCVAILLAILGLVFSLQRWQNHPDIKNNYALFFLLSLILFFLFSLGPPSVKDETQRYPNFFMIFYHWFPGVSGMKVPARAGIMVMFSIAALSAYGMTALSHYMLRMGLNLKVRQSCLILVLVLIGMEYWAVPVNRTPNQPYLREANLPPVYQWLSEHSDDVAVIELPLNDVWEETKQMYYSTYHWKKRVNGYSGYISPLLDRLSKMGVDHLYENALLLLWEHRVKYILLHTDRYPQTVLHRITKQAMETGLVKKCCRFENVLVLEIL